MGGQVVGVGFDDGLVFGQDGEAVELEEDLPLGQRAVGILQGVGGLVLLLDGGDVVATVEVAVLALTFLALGGFVGGTDGVLVGLTEADRGAAAQAANPDAQETITVPTGRSASTASATTVPTASSWSFTPPSLQDSAELPRARGA